MPKSHNPEHIRIVQDAVRDGKFFPEREDFWLNALSEDPVGARRVIDSLFSYKPAIASSRGRNYNLLSPVGDEPGRYGVDMDAIAQDENYRRAVHQMGPLFSAGIEPPPHRATYSEPHEQAGYTPPQFVVSDDGQTGYWTEPKYDVPDWQVDGSGMANNVGVHPDAFNDTTETLGDL